MKGGYMKRRKEGREGDTYPICHIEHRLPRPGIEEIVGAALLAEAVFEAIDATLLEPEQRHAF
jgi:hypothetical protein